MRTWRLREGTCQGHRTDTWLSLHLNPSLPDPKAAALPPVPDFNPDSGGRSWEAGKGVGLPVTLHNLTVSMQRLSSDRSHAQQALGTQRHLGCPRGQCPENTLSGCQRHAQEARKRKGGWLARWGCWDRSLNTLPNPALGPQ